MEHFIKEIHIHSVRHLKDIHIGLDSDHRQHLILTGRNGSGKTSVLNEIANNLVILNRSTDTDLLEVRRQLRQDMNLLDAGVDERKRAIIEDINSLREMALSSCPITKLDVIYNHEEDLPSLYRSGEFITAFFVAGRPSNDVLPAHGVEDIRLSSSIGVTESPSRDIMKYMVHLKTQQSYAKNENDTQNERYIGEWFDRFEKALRTLLDDDSIELKYDYKNYSFVIHQKNRNPSSLNELSDGYSSILRILSDLIMRMDQNWLHKNQLSEYNKEGVVLIDEVETHLHIELQRKILPFLTEFFPRLQFIVSTHSPYVLTSLSNVVVYDLERQVMLSDLSEYSTDDVANGFFEAENYSVELEETLNRYKELLLKPDISDDERAERADLRIKLRNIPGEFGRSIRAEFDIIEQERKR